MATCVASQGSLGPHVHHTLHPESKETKPSSTPVNGVQASISASERGSKLPVHPTRGFALPYQTVSGISLIDRFIDEPRPLRVAVIGGGLAGILAGILLPAKVPGIDLTIYEKNHEFVSGWLCCVINLTS